MPLFKSHERYSDSQTAVDDHDISGAEVYVRPTRDRESEKVGSVYTVLVDECDRLRYLVLATDHWAAGKKVLLPIGRCTDDPEHNRIYVAGLTKAQIADLPNYHDTQVIDQDYEGQVRTAYLAAAAERSAPVESEVAVESATTTRHHIRQPPATVVGADRTMVAPSEPANAASPGADGDLYTVGTDQHRLKLYEERLVAAKRRQKTGEVTVTKQVETQPADAAVPVRKERIVIEIEAVDGATQVNLPDRHLQAGEAAQMDVYQEAATFRKEPVVRQAVTIRKEVDETVERQTAQLRRETLDIHQTGSPEVSDRTPQSADS